MTPTEAIASIRASIAAGYSPSLSDIEVLIAECGRVEVRLIANGEIAKAPCFICGFNGAGYFNPGAHPCAARHHAAITQAEEKGNG